MVGLTENEATQPSLAGAWAELGKNRIQEEYILSPVGPYEGPYDQDPQIPLNAQLPKSTMTF